MFKNKLKSVLLLLMLISFLISPFSFADDETENEVTTDDTEQSTIATEGENVAQEEKTNEENQEAPASKENEKQVISTREVKDFTSHEDKYFVGDSITIDNPIDGNAYIVANSVTIKSQIMGNAFICANSITVTEQGFISNSLYAAANKIDINGIVYDLYSTSNSLTFKGYINRDVHAVAENIRICGTINRNATLSFENIEFTSSNENDDSMFFQGKIIGNLTYYAKNEIDISKEYVDGEIKYEHVDNIRVSPNYVFLAISFIVLVLAVWFIYNKFAKKFLDSLETTLSNKPIKTFGFGFLSLIVLPIIAALLLVLGITASVGLLLLAVFLILVCISGATFIIAINNIVLKKLNYDTKVKQVLLLVGISLLAWILTIIPFVGSIVTTVYVITGLGLITQKIFRKKEDE